MEKIEEMELQKIKGGTISTGTLLAITGGLIFIFGVIDGYLNPTKCKK